MGRDQCLLRNNVGMTERDRQKRSATATRDASVGLLRAVGELRTLTEDIRSYRGDASGMRRRVEEVLKHAESTRLHAASIGMLAPGQLAEPAEKVAVAARTLADDVVRNTDLDRGVLIGFADTSALDGRINVFRAEAVKYVRE
jgi:hypothetical protein